MATVLYVDDEVPIRRAVAAWLTRKGHVVHEAGDAGSARAIIAEHARAIDGIFVDLWLGTESGVALFEWLQAAFPALASRVAFVTGDLLDTTVLERRQGHRVFGKPFELKDLEAQAREWGGTA